MTLPDNTAIYYHVNGEEKLIDDTKHTRLVLHGGPGISDHTLYLPLDIAKKHGIYFMISHVF